MNKPIIAPGSMLNSSEGLISTGSLAALTTSLTTHTDWRVQIASAAGIALLAAVYVWTRATVKRAELEREVYE
jgi:hypothetical protein